MILLLLFMRDLYKLIFHWKMKTKTAKKLKTNSELILIGKEKENYKGKRNSCEINKRVKMELKVNLRNDEINDKSVKEKWNKNKSNPKKSA